jgi:hypothetical protein
MANNVLSGSRAGIGSAVVGSTATNAYNIVGVGVVGGTGVPPENASKLVSYAVLTPTVLENTGKLAAYAVLNQPLPAHASKLVEYAVLNAIPPEKASKLISYAVIQPLFPENASKLVSYAVLTTPKHTLVTARDLICVAYHEAQQVLSPADIAIIDGLIKRDDPPGAIVPGAFSREGLLVIPGRGVLTLQPGDVVAVDQNGWPVLVSAYSIATSGWVFT